MVKFNQHFDNPDQLKAQLRRVDRPELEMEYLEVQDALEDLAVQPVSRENHRQQVNLETYRDALVTVLNEKPIDELALEEEAGDSPVEASSEATLSEGESQEEDGADSSINAKGAAFLSNLGQQVKRGVQASGQAINRGFEHEMAKKEPWKEKKAALEEERRRAKAAKEEAQALANQAQYKAYPKKRRRGCGCSGCLLVIVLALVLGYAALSQAQVYLPNLSFNAPDITVDGGSLIQEGWEYAKSWLTNLFSSDQGEDSGQGWQAPADNGGGTWQGQEAPATDNGWTEPSSPQPAPAPTPDPAGPSEPSY
ncbi:MULTISPECIES: hypothetical protein [Aerococcus]|uniref:Uncharacterized protein n=1 Tax=Aerococcus sanguinicola TaxID=119206 RepID=A0A5N1GLR9_9LACT|nr:MULTISPECIES: hypothetical protein [Aerococcus]KAA9301927.1 hypothetical protein F6I03_01595 [Aerococcus sanguinicola]MDK6368651.1 hypothetical protein [Aerococcus sp. UMB9870]MDK6679734.1 hypothetical protein [Aerococcus sp. UMB8608]MDK6685994.1 hypothetical protein [Aerococcus sp. UMB8623]MDK6940800.1 hypothetical protein [Aerococcus sp. UMB8487]